LHANMVIDSVWFIPLNPLLMGQAMNYPPELPVRDQEVGICGCYWDGIAIYPSRLYHCKLDGINPNSFQRATYFRLMNNSDIL